MDLENFESREDFLDMVVQAINHSIRMAVTMNEPKVGAAELVATFIYANKIYITQQEFETICFQIGVNPVDVCPNGGGHLSAQLFYMMTKSVYANKGAKEAVFSAHAYIDPESGNLVHGKFHFGEGNLILNLLVELMLSDALLTNVMKKAIDIYEKEKLTRLRDQGKTNSN